jgi:hypothetical protein
MQRHQAVLGAVGGHPDDLEGAEVGRDEREAGDPGGHGSPGEEEVVAGTDGSSSREADSQHGAEIDQQDQVVGHVEIEPQPLRREYVHGPPPSQIDRDYPPRRSFTRERPEA